MTTTPEMLPCPFCGGNDLDVLPVWNEDPAFSNVDTIYAYEVFCQSCHASGPRCVAIGWLETQESAIEQWNIRKEFVPKKTDITAMEVKFDTSDYIGLSFESRSKQYLDRIEELEAKLQKAKDILKIWNDFEDLNIKLEGPYGGTRINEIIKLTKDTLKEIE